VKLSLQGESFTPARRMNRLNQKFRDETLRGRIRIVAVEQNIGVKKTVQRA
jgi:hypothetical protein